VGSIAFDLRSSPPRSRTSGATISSGGWPMGMRRNSPASSATCKNQLAQRLGFARDFGVGQVADEPHRFFAGGRSVWQFDPFFVRQDAMAEIEMEEIKRHMTLLDNPPRLNSAVRSVWHPLRFANAFRSALT